MPKLSIEFDREEEQKLSLIKKKTGIKSTTEVIRNLITLKSEEIAKELTLQTGQSVNPRG